MAAQLPSWISELRNAWNQEIEQLPDDRKRFFIAQQTDFLRRSTLASPPSGMADVLSPSASLESSRLSTPQRSPRSRLDLTAADSPIIFAGESLPSTSFGLSVSPSTFATPPPSVQLPASAISAPSPHPLHPSHAMRAAQVSASTGGTSSLTASLAASIVGTSTSSTSESVSIPPVAMPVSQPAPVTSMPLPQRWHSAILPSPSPSSQSTLFGRFGAFLFGSSSKSEQDKAEVLKHSEKLKLAIAQHEQRLMKALKERKIISRRMQVECDQFANWGLDSLVSATRTLFETQLIRLGAHMELEGQISSILSSQINAAQAFIEKGDAPLPVGQAPLLRDRDGHLVDVDKLCSPLSGYLPAEAHSLYQQIRALSSVIEHLQQAYDSKKTSDLKVESTEQRSRRLEDSMLMGYMQHEFDSDISNAVVVSDQGASHSVPVGASPTIGGMYFHPSGAEQHAFSQLVIDQRQSEGQKLARWEKWFNEATHDQRSVEAVTAFLLYLTQLIQSKYNVKSHLASSGAISSCLQLCCSRLIFHRLQLNGHISSLATHAEIAADRRLLRRLRWLQCAEQIDVGIEPEFVFQWSSDRAERLIDGDPNFAVFPAQLQLLSGSFLRSQSFSSSDVVPQATPRASALKSKAPPMTPNSVYAALPPRQRACLIRRSCWPSAGDISSSSAWQAPEIDHSFPYARAIAQLAHVRDQCVPEDILRTLLEAVREIHNCAREYHHQYHVRQGIALEAIPAPVIGADALFPLVVWCVLHAHAPLHTALARVERCFGEQQLQFGEVGLYLTVVKAACQYLSNVRPRELRLPGGLPRFIRRFGLDPPPRALSEDTSVTAAYAAMLTIAPPVSFQVPWPSTRVLQQVQSEAGGQSDSDVDDMDDEFDSEPLPRASTWAGDLARRGDVFASPMPPQPQLILPPDSPEQQPEHHAELVNTEPCGVNSEVSTLTADITESTEALSLDVTLARSPVIAEESSVAQLAAEPAHDSDDQGDTNSDLL